jgi:hypothetical protein
LDIDDDFGLLEAQFETFDFPLLARIFSGKRILCAGLRPLVLGLRACKEPASR